MKDSQPRLLRHVRGTDRALSSNNAFKHAQAHALVLYQSQALYTYIPKNACSTLRLAVAIANGFAVGIEDVNWIHENNMTFRADLADVVKARYTFVVLRDPFKRLISCFYDKFVDKTEVMWQFIKLSGRNINPDKLTFRDFVLQLPALLPFNAHWRPQADFLLYEDYDDWFSLEQFDKAILTLNDKIGLNIVDTREALGHDTSRLKMTRSKEFGPDTPIEKLAGLKRSGLTPHPKNMFDGPLLKATRNLYRQDIEVYKDKIGIPLLFDRG